VTRPAVVAGTIALALAPFGCGTQSIPYRCEGGAAVTAIYHGKNVQLQLPDTSVTLPQQQSADGARYGNDTYTFWTKGNEALVQRGDLIVYRHCLSQQ
jgi:membrane-bound inhibitor of C-type lysozyme